MSDPADDIAITARLAIEQAAARVERPVNGTLLHHTLTRQYLHSLPAGADIGARYEALVGRSIAFDDAGRPRSVAGKGRRRSGAYYTPPELVDELISAALTPLLDERLRNAADTAAALLGIRILDPACGAGAFLMAALDALAERLARLRSGDPDDARRAVLRNCICGVDSDPLAVDVCRRRLAETAGLPADTVSGVQCGDSLLAPPPILRGEPSFDCVLGNPPFLNAIERSGREERRAALARITPELGGTADEAFHFAALATRLAKPDGRIGLVMPRTVLNAPAAEALRDANRSAWRPRYIRVLDRPDHFRGPQVYVCLVVLGPAGPCRVVRGQSAAEGRLDDTNWWRGIQALLDGRTTIRDAGPAAGTIFEIRAGMTAGEAYEARPGIEDARNGTALKLVTTGLIDPDTCLWGARRCRYLGRDFDCPRVSAIPGATGALRRRLDEARRPKVIVAGLSARIECFLDALGEYVGAVSTFAVFHPKDDVTALRALKDALLRPEATDRYERELGANALGGGSIRMTKAFLRDFPFAG